jgi:hypothetical protein
MRARKAELLGKARDITADEGELVKNFTNPLRIGVFWVLISSANPA